MEHTTPQEGGRVTRIGHPPARAVRSVAVSFRQLGRIASSCDARRAQWHAQTLDECYERGLGHFAQHAEPTPAAHATQDFDLEPAPKQLRPVHAARGSVK